MSISVEKARELKVCQYCEKALVMIKGGEEYPHPGIVDTAKKYAHKECAMIASLKMGNDKVTIETMEDKIALISNVNELIALINNLPDIVLKVRLTLKNGRWVTPTVAVELDRETGEYYLEIRE